MITVPQGMSCHFLFLRGRFKKKSMGRLKQSKWTTPVD